MKVKVHDLQILDALLKRLAIELNPNIQPTRNPQLVILLNGQLVAGDYFPKYENGCPCINNPQQIETDDYIFSSEKVMTPINYHTVQRFYFRQFGTKKASLEFLFKNPDILFSLLKKQPLNFKFEEGEPYIYNPRLLWQETPTIRFMALDKDAEYELISLFVQHEDNL